MTGRRATPFAALIALQFAGCAALSNPVAEGVPVRRLPPEVLGESRESVELVPLDQLRHPRPDPYRLAPGDVLAVVVEGVLGERNQPAPVRLTDTGSLPPATGYPVPVQDDGTITLPQSPPIPVAGMSLAEAQAALRRAFVDRQIARPDAQISAALLQPRRVKVLVVREDGTTNAPQTVPVANLGTIGIVPGSNRRGGGAAVALPAYENDVLTALVQSGGVPGLDAKDEVLVRRAAAGAPPVRVPIRQQPGKPRPVRPDDVVLRDGDTVVVEARVPDIYYTGGLLGSGQYPLPRDYDLDVVQAVAQVRGPMVNGGFSQTAFVANSVSGGLGQPSPSLVSVVRKLANGGQVVIRVDLNRALQDPRERILVMPGDTIVMQETPGEAFGRWASQTFRFDLFGVAARRRDFSAVGTFAPLPGAGAVAP